MQTFYQPSARWYLITTLKSVCSLSEWKFLFEFILCWFLNYIFVLVPVFSHLVGFFLFPNWRQNLQGWLWRTETEQQLEGPNWKLTHFLPSAPKQKYVQPSVKGLLAYFFPYTSLNNCEGVEVHNSGSRNITKQRQIRYLCWEDREERWHLSNHREDMKRSKSLTAFCNWTWSGRSGI